MVRNRLVNMLTEGGLSVAESELVIRDLVSSTSMLHFPFKTWTCSMSELNGPMRGFIAGMAVMVVQHTLGFQLINNPAMQTAIEEFLNTKQ